MYKKLLSVTTLVMALMLCLVVMASAEGYYTQIDVKSVKNTQEGVVVDWKDFNGDFYTYGVYRNTAGTDIYNLIGTTEKSKFTDTTAVNGTKYEYIVFCIKDYSETAPSSFENGNSIYCIDDVTISSVKCTDSNTLTVKWKKNPEATKYEVSYSTSSSFKTEKIITVKGTSAELTGLKYNTRYYVRVRAIISKSKSAWSDKTSGTVTKLNAPTIKASQDSTKYIKLSWSKITGAKSYSIYRATSKSGKYSKIATVTSTSYKDSDITVGKTYYYKAVANGSKSDYKSTASSIISAKSAITAPKLRAKANVTSSSIKISWSKVSGVDGYVVYRKDAGASGSYKKIKTIKSGSTTSYTDKSAQSVSEYVVKAYKKSGDSTLYSEKSNAVTARELDKPVITVEAYEDELKNKITWDAVDGATSYQVYYKATRSGSWKLLKEVTGTSCNDKISNGKLYYYKVRALYKTDNCTSYGEYSDEQNKIQYYKPQYKVSYVDIFGDETYVVAIVVENVGDSTLRIFSDNAALVDATSSSYNRNLQLYDYDAAIDDDELIELDYIDIKSGEKKMVLFGINDDPTRYTKDSAICYYFRYDGIIYYAESSYNVGSYYDFYEIA